MTARFIVLPTALLFVSGFARPQSTDNDAARARAANQAALVENFNAGVKALGAKQFQAAIDSLSRAGALDPKQHVVWAQLATAYSGLADTKTGAERSQLLLKAVDAYRQAVELHGDDAGYQNNYGLALAQAGSVPEACAAFEKAIRLDPARSASYRLNLGIVLRRAGRNRESIQALIPIPSDSPAYARAAWLRSVDTVAVYLESAKNNFRDIRGKQTMTREEMRKMLETAAKDTGKSTADISPYPVWDSNLSLPGGACSVSEFTGSNEVQCAFNEAPSVDRLRSAYDNLVAMAKEALDPIPAGWISTEAVQPPADGLKHVFKGPHTELRVEVYRKQTYENGQLGTAYRSMIRVIQN